MSTSSIKKIPGELETAFIGATFRGDLDTMAAHIAAGVDVNYVDPWLGMGALHIATLRVDRAGLRLLAGSGRCDFSLKDQNGRRASLLAYLQGEPPLGVWLTKRQYAQVRQPA